MLWVFIRLTVLGFNNMSTLVGHFVSSPRERDKTDRRDSRGDKRGTGKKERDREERGTGMKVKKQNENIPPLPLPATKDSKPCPTVSQFWLDAPVT